jgi:CRISPR-associated protein Cas5t
MAGMRALKITTEAVTSSFRYPHIQIGKLPTYEVPPPATIYGHLAGVLGEWFEADGLEFSYVFEHKGKALDVETGHPIERGSGKFTLKGRNWNFPVNVECQTNPQRREFLFRPRLTLFLKGPEQLLDRFHGGFLNPAYSYILGRSQDLATCVDAQWVELGDSDEAFFSHTILPFEWRQWVLPGTTIQLPRSLNYYRQREPEFAVYLQVLWPALKLYLGSQDAIGREKLPKSFAVDMTDQREFSGRKLSRGLFFHPVIGPGAALS